MRHVNERDGQSSRLSDRRHANEGHARRPSDTGCGLSTQGHNNGLYCAWDHRQAAPESGMAAPVSGMPTTADGKAEPAILVVTPIDSCTTKSSVKGPVNQITNEIISTIHKRGDFGPRLKLAAAEAGLFVIHASI